MPTAGVGRLVPNLLASCTAHHTSYCGLIWGVRKGSITGIIIKGDTRSLDYIIGLIKGDTRGLDYIIGLIKGDTRSLDYIIGLIKGDARS